MLAVRGERPNFTVTQSQLPIWHAKPQAYPFILRGCSWGTCSAPDSDLPKQVSALRLPVYTWRTTQVLRRTAGTRPLDTCLGTHPMTTGQADGADDDLLARHIKVPPRTRILHIDHVRWYPLHWRACHAYTCWNYIQFRRVWLAAADQATASAPLHPPCAAARLDPASTWWLENIEAGFELWQGGAGLATDWSWPGARCPAQYRAQQLLPARRRLAP